jgi:hypothetical protein
MEKFDPQEKRAPENHVYCTTLLTTPVRLPPHTIISNGLPFIYLDKAHSQHTIGVEFSSRTVKLGEKRIKLQVCSYYDARPRTQYSISFGILRGKNDSGS